MSTEDIILASIIQRRKRVQPTIRYKRLTLDQWPDEKCKSKTRFTHKEIKRICDLANIDNKLQFNDFSISGDLALAILLTYLAYPRNYSDMSDIFGISKGNISRVVNGMSKIMYDKFKEGIKFDEVQFSKENLERFSTAIFNRGAILPNIVGFIDGTMQQISRPKNHEIQKLMYNGWKKIHCIKFQAIVTPDGITSSLYGPYHGSQNDSGMLNESNLVEKISAHFANVSPDKIYAIYGDDAYSLSEHIIPPFNRHRADETEQEVNKSMAKVRIAVEMEFGKIVQFFPGSKYKLNNQALKNKPALKYILATLFKNFHTCIHGSAASKMFKLKPPTLEEYITRLMRHTNQNDIVD